VVVIERPIQSREVKDTGLVHEDLLLERLYRARGVRSMDELDLSLNRLLPIHSLDGVHQAVELLVQALQSKWPLVIVGDYDADGATATALMWRALRGMGFVNVRFLVPDRQTMGYGLGEAIVQVAAELTPKPQLIITVDNGISSLAGVALARQWGMKVLVTDHHLPGPELPVADAIVNPNVPGATFASKALAGVGVAFYVMAALAHKLKKPNSLVSGLLDLVALGTVADVVPLDQNNRILVQAGLARIRQGDCCVGIKALSVIAKRALARLSPQDLGFALGPRLNAAGRLEDMSIGIECLITDDLEQASLRAEALNRINLDRRAIESSMQAEAQKLTERLCPSGDPARWPAAICLYADEWHGGVVGLVASKIRERVHRPVAAFAPNSDGTIRGSLRSVPGVHIRDVLAAIDARYPSLMGPFGGHAMAAGMTITKAHIPTFAEALAAEVARVAEPHQLTGLLLTDGPLEPSQLTLETAESLLRAGPFGSGFAEPLFVNTFTVADTQLLQNLHLKCWVRLRPQDTPIEAMYFFYSSFYSQVPPIHSKVRLCYQLDVNEFRNERKLQLLVETLKIEAVAA
jgi:single-stranded-DNA-specific exonuclease